jgi:hypothetical protein
VLEAKFKKHFPQDIGSLVAECRTVDRFASQAPDFACDCFNKLANRHS